MDQVKNHTLDNQQVTAVVDRLLIHAQGDYSRYIAEKDKVELLSELRVSFTEESIKELIFRICSHGFSWEQLQLIRSTSLASWQFLCWVDRSAAHGGMRILARSFLGDFINENSHKYESNIALATYSECKNVSRYTSLINQKTSQAWKTICYYFNHRMKFHEKLEEAHLNRDDTGYN
ncbi:putative inner membrane domain protein [Chlamydia psittaci VS225]|nr:putative inner membrane domain protein [Chlamydia psittaci VS225]